VRQRLPAQLDGVPDIVVGSSPHLFGAQAATECGLKFFGVDQVLFASDTPFEPTPGLYLRETIRVIESLGLTADEKDRIYRGNAARLLNLPRTY